MTGFTNESWFKRAKAVLPGGVSSPIRSFYSVGGTPFFVDRANGQFLYDIEGKRYLDFINSYGAIILGHAHPKVVEAIKRASENGTSYGTPTVIEVEFAELICSKVKGLEMLRFVSSGTEATMSAVRLARAATGRKKIVKFSGCYHGHVDALLVEGGSFLSNYERATSKGVTQAQIEDTLVVDYNGDLEIEKDVACVIVEPVAANMGVVKPKPGWLEKLRLECSQAGAILIFDEVITGFRIGPGGASTYFNVIPDLWTFGKVIGGGLPVGAFGGRRDLMEMISPAGDVFQAGTLSANPISLAAGKTTLEELGYLSYEDLSSKVNKLAIGLQDVIGQRGIAVRIAVLESLMSIFFSNEEILNFKSAKRSVASGRYRQFFHHMLEQGIALAPGGYEAMFMSFAFGDKDIEKTLQAADYAAFKLAGTESI